MLVRHVVQPEEHESNEQLNKLGSCVRKKQIVDAAEGGGDFSLTSYFFHWYENSLEKEESDGWMDGKFSFSAFFGDS